MGYTGITRIGDPDGETGIAFGLQRMERGERLERGTSRETAVLVLAGRLSLRAGPVEAKVSRSSLFDGEPVTIHVCAGTQITIVAEDACELALLEVENERAFAPVLFDRRTMAETERRGKGMLGDAAYRIVRTVFDTRNRPEANLVLGEVVTLPGRWSSYPPHHHPQPEIYHYRFDHPSGFGFSELGDSVLRIRNGDTLVIPPGADHAQVAAPGYAMYYLWAIRHLEGMPYLRPEFTEAHRRLLEPGVRVWHPKEDAS